MAQTPNILLITTDQQRWDTIHARGNTHIYTPHLNWLCDTGIWYSRAYSECPVCMPARATIMTGLPGYLHGSVDNDDGEPIRGRPTTPSVLTARGYETRGQGKMHFHPMRKKFGFETMEISLDYYRGRSLSSPGEVGLQHGLGQNEMEPAIGSVDSNRTLTRWVVDRSVDFLDTRDRERPFFLWSSFSKPHPPFDPSLRFWELYRDAQMPEVVLGDWSADPAGIHPSLAEPTWKLNNAQRFSPSQIQQIRRAYYACITEVDYALGRLFAELRERGLLHNTMIVFASDHGEMLGDHNLGAKSLFLEPAAHVPLIIRPPGEDDNDPRRGTVCNQIVGLQDILPTVLNAAGCGEQIPPDVPGIDLLAAAAAEGAVTGAHGRQQFFGQCAHRFMHLNGDWKYLYSAAGGHRMLFNLAQDPMERDDLAGEEPQRCESMHAELVAALGETPGGAPYFGSAAVEGSAPGAAPVLEDVRRFHAWPGFHSNPSETDLLH